MNTELLDATGPEKDTAIERAAAYLKEGSLVAFPTETVYGLGAIGNDPKAILRIFEAKKRPADNPLILHCSGVDQMSPYVQLVPEAEMLFAEFSPGPLTIVLPATEMIPPIARAHLSTVAVRIPDHSVALPLIEKTGPLVAPSANLSGRPSPTTAHHVMDDLAGRIAAVLDGGPCQIGIESTVLDLSQSSPAILRPGLIEESEIEEVIGIPVVNLEEHKEDEEHVKSPGVKYRHYAPTVPIRLVISYDLPAVAEGESTLILTTERNATNFSTNNVRILHIATLYHELRRGEEVGVDEILIYAKPGELPSGLKNRLEKAAGE